MSDFTACGTIDFVVKDVKNGQYLDFQLLPDDSISSVKTMIKDIISDHPNPDFQVLVYSGRVLSDDMIVGNIFKKVSHSKAYFRN